MHQSIETTVTVPRAPGHSGEFYVYPGTNKALLKASYSGDIRTLD